MTTERWDVNSAAYATGIAQYEALLVNAGKRPRWLPRPTITPLTRAESEVGAQMISELEHASFRPVVRTRTDIPGGRVTSEFWADPAGTTSLEVAPASGMYFVSTYFDDGTSITVHPPDAMLSGSVRRKLVQGRGELAHDLRLAVDVRDARLGRGGNALPIVDPETARLRVEVHGRLIAPNTAALFSAALIRFILGDGTRIAVIAIVTGVVYWVTRWPPVLVIGAVAAMLQHPIAAAYSRFARRRRGGRRP